MNKVKIYGGLGNQMFQYALCIALNQKGNKSRISFSNFLYEFHHNGFNLGRAFKLKLPFPLNFLNFFLLNGYFFYKNRYVRFISTRVLKYYHKVFYTTYMEEKEFIYDSKLFEQKSRLLVGVWQVESYFSNVRNIVIENFVFRIPSDNKNIELIKKIISCNSVSVHIRKGDYESIRWKNQLGYVNYYYYYKRALYYLKEKIDDSVFFIFSDDIEWVKNNLEIPNSIYIDHNKGQLSYIDMYLMSLCKHNIIANSTFSWWGAWLNKNENKIIVMPQKWIHKGYYPEGIFPKDWIKINEE